MHEALLLAHLKEHNLASDTIQQLAAFWGLFLAQNEALNLSAIVEPEAVATKHFADSLSALPNIAAGAKVLDVGSGGGFPAIPLAICKPDAQFTLLDSTAKKTAYLSRVAGELGLHNVRVQTGRAEVLAHGDMRETFDVVTARAVAALTELLELATPFLKVGGILLAYKGALAAEEVAAANSCFTALSCRVEALLPYQIANDRQHTLVVIEKQAPTKPRFPRTYQSIKKRPL